MVVARTRPHDGSGSAGAAASAVGLQETDTECTPLLARFVTLPAGFCEPRGGAIARIGAAQEDAPGRCRTAVTQAHVHPPAALDAAATEDSRAHALAGINRYDQLVMV
jgi:hypothetical protein